MFKYKSAFHVFKLKRESEVLFSEISHDRLQVVYLFGRYADHIVHYGRLHFQAAVFYQNDRVLGGGFIGSRPVPVVN